MPCPSCGASVPNGALECASCGVILAKARPRTESRPRPPILSTPKPAPLRRVPVGVIAAGLAIFVLMAGAVWMYFRKSGGGPSLSSRGGSRSLERIPARDSDFDLAYQVPGSPQGVASNGREIVIGNRRDPWGLIRLRRSEGDTFTVESIPLIEPTYNQKMSVSALTWNGAHYVGYTTATWFGQQSGDAFTIHDPKTLQIVEWKPAPKQLGCLAWDGTSYWAATRKNTQDEDAPAYLYRLDKAFNVVGKSEPPNVGCQGLAWDGRHLWFADVFSDAISVLDVSGEKPSLVRRTVTELSYLSGIASFEDHIWIVEYDDNRLQRLSQATRVAWSGVAAAPARVVAASALQPPSADVTSLRQKLRSESWSDRLRAKSELQRLGEPIDFDRDQDSFPDRDADDTNVDDWSVELRDGGIYGSWRLWFGADLFANHEPASTLVTIPVFARYTITVRDPNGAKTEREFNAHPGDNVMSGVRLADAGLAGEYTVDVFLHAQYVKASGEAQILNENTTSLSVSRK